MYKIISLFFTCLVMGVTNAQKLTLQQKIKIGINGSANQKFQVIYLDPKTDVSTIQHSKVYDIVTNAVISYQLLEKPDWTKARALNKTNGDASLPQLFKKDAVYIADIKPDEGRLIVYFWPFQKSGNKEKKASGSEVTAANSFIKSKSFSIPLEERTNLSLYSSAWHVGVMAIPLKIFLGTPDSVSAVQSSINAGLYFGRRWGKTKYVKLPNQKEISTYQTSWSLNLFSGLSKLDIDDKNTSDKGTKFKGSVASFSYGLMGAYHYRNFSIFLSLGDDKPLSKRASNWLLNKKPWIGIGFGFDIL